MARQQFGKLRLLRHPAQYVVVAFVVATAVGTVLLLLPFSAQERGTTTPMEALFTAASAVCVTGLVVVDTPTHWSGFGQWVILGLIQVGGLGIMTLSSLIVLTLARRLGLRQRLNAAASTNSLDLTDVRGLLVGIARLTFTFQSVVAVLLTLRLWLEHGEPLGRAAYLGLFHAVSAFNNAGFALYSDSLIGFAEDSFLLLVVGVAVVAGGLGFPVWVQVGRHPWRPHWWTLHAKLTVATAGVLIVIGTVLLAWFEWTNPDTFGPLSAWDSSVNALFHSITPRTAGFNSIDVAGLREPSLLLTEILMFIGGGSGSTAGGIKVTTFALLGFVMWAEARGDPDVVVFDRRVPHAVQRQALSVALLAVGMVVASTMVLLSITPQIRANLLFEVISALGTVGLSTGITAELTTSAQLLVVGLMLIGRVGPVTLFAALVLRERDRLYHHPNERPLIG